MVGNDSGLDGLTKEQRELVADKARAVLELQKLREEVARINLRMIDGGLANYARTTVNSW